MAFKFRRLRRPKKRYALHILRSEHELRRKRRRKRRARRRHRAVESSTTSTTSLYSGKAHKRPPQEATETAPTAGGVAETPARRRGSGYEASGEETVASQGGRAERTQRRRPAHERAPSRAFIAKFETPTAESDSSAHCMGCARKLWGRAKNILCHVCKRARANHK